MSSKKNTQKVSILCDSTIRCWRGLKYNNLWLEKPGGKAFDNHFYLDICTLTLFYCLFVDSIVFSIVLKDAVQSPQNIPFIQSLARFKLVDKKLNILETNHPDFAHPKPQPPPTEKFTFMYIWNQGVMSSQWKSNFFIGWH